MYYLVAQGQNKVKVDYKKSLLKRANLQYADNDEDALNMIQSAVRVILVVANNVGKSFIMKYYNGLDTFDNIAHIFAYTKDISKTTIFY